MLCYSKQVLRGWIQTLRQLSARSEPHPLPPASRDCLSGAGLKQPGSAVRKVFSTEPRKRLVATESRATRGVGKGEKKKILDSMYEPVRSFLIGILDHEKYRIGTRLSPCSRFLHDCASLCCCVAFAFATAPECLSESFTSSTHRKR